MANKIQVDLLLNDAQAKGKLTDFVKGMAKQGFIGPADMAGRNPEAFRKLAASLGLAVEQAVKTGVAKGATAPAAVSGLQSALGTISKYVVGRGLANLALGNIGGGVAGLSGAAFASGNPYAIAAAAAVDLAIAFGKLISKMGEWAEAGAKLFQRAAKVGLSSGQTFLAQTYAGILGVSPEQVEQLILRGQFGAGRGQGGGRGGISRSIPGLGYLAGRGPSGSGEIQQLTNMAKSLSDYADSIKKTLAEDTIVAQRTAGFNERVSLGFGRIGTELELFKMQVVTDLAPAINTMTELLSDFIHNLTKLAAGLGPALTKMMVAIAALISIKSPELGATLLANIAGSDLKQNNTRQTPFQRGGVSSLEKIGLVIGGGHDKVLTKLSQIEQHTRVLAQHATGALSRGGGFPDALGLYTAHRNTP